MTIFLGFHYFGKDLMIFFRFSLFEKVLPRAPRVFAMFVNLVYIE